MDFGFLGSFLRYFSRYKQVGIAYSHTFHRPLTVNSHTRVLPDGYRFSIRLRTLGIELSVIVLLFTSMAWAIGRLAIAYGISLVVAISMGVLAAEHKRIAAVFYPLYDIGQGVPILALFPVLFLGLKELIGIDYVALELTCITMLVLDMIWYMFLNIVSAVKNIPTEIKEVGQLFGFKGLKRITHIVILSILPL